MGRRNKAKLFSPHSRNTGGTRLRRICIISAAVLAGLIILLVTGYYQLLSYLQGDSFRQTLNESTRNSLHAGQFELLSNLRINGNRVSTDGINIAHLSNIEMAQATGINAELNRAALLSRQVHLHKLAMEDAAIVINTGTPTARTSGKSDTTQNKKQASSRKQKATAAQPAASTLAFSPKSLQLDYFECRDTDLQLANQGQTYQLLGASVSASPAPKVGKKAWQINAENGRLHTPFTYIRESSIKSATIIYNADSLDLTDCKLILTPGEMRAKAHYDTRQHRWTADIQINKANPHRILNDDWKKRLHGELYGRLVLTGTAGGVGTASGNLSLQNGLLEGLPILSQLPLGSTLSYRSIELEKSDCQLLYPYKDRKIGEAWIFDKININAKDGSLLIRGHVLIGKEKQLGGTLTFGIPEQLVEALPIPREILADKLFTAKGEEEGYLWVKMNLSGTLDNPQEDLSVRLTTLISKQMGNLISSGSASSMLNSLFNISTTKESKEQKDEPESTPDTKNPLQSAAESAGSLLQSLF